jgi:6-phosphogluconolactonase (cycloisomerase 2 family)
MSAAVDGATRFELLVGCYTRGGGEGIYRLAFDAASGHLGPTLQVQPAGNPSWLVVDDRRGQLFAVNEQAPGRVDSFSLDPRSHRLAPLNRVDSQGSAPTHASLSPDGRRLMVANYGGEPPGAGLAVLPVADDGRLGPAVQVLRYRGSGANPERQADSHVHGAVFSPDGRRLYVSDLGADRVFVYDYHAGADPSLTPASPDQLILPPGSGPRHLLFSADGRQAWLTLELSAQVATFALDDGRLQRRQLIDLDDGSGRTHAAGGLHLSADGRFLYVADRGETNELVVFAVAADGTLQPVQRRSAEGREPREFALSPDGRLLLVANQFSGDIVVLRRDPASGRLGETLQRLPLAAVSYLHVLPAVEAR